MLEWIKWELKRLLFRYGYIVRHVTSTDRLSEFFDMVKPLNVGIPLVRIGSSSDGGYLIPDDLENISACFSPGVSDVSDFELELANRGIKSFLADYSVDAPPIQNKLFDFDKKYLGAKDDDIIMTLESWVNAKSTDGSDLILQMDIEGAEYSVIHHASISILKRFRIIVIEFHNLDLLLDRVAFELIYLAFLKLNNDFYVVHIHPNNCCPPVQYKNIEIPPVMEFTFFRRGSVLDPNPVASLPHPLDRRNVLSNPDVNLPECWYKTT